MSTRSCWPPRTPPVGWSPPLTEVAISGLQLPDVTVFVNSGPAADPASLIGSSQPASPNTVPVPIVPPTC